MSVVMKIVFSLSLSGSLLILVLLLCKPLFRKRFSRQWQYYIWLVVIARLLLPVAPEVSLVGKLFSRIEHGAQTDIRIASVSVYPEEAHSMTPYRESSPDGAETADRVAPYHENSPNNAETAGSVAPYQANSPNDTDTALSVPYTQNNNITQKLLANLWMPWMVIALLLLIRKITIYQSFVKYIKAGRREIADTVLLDRLAQIGEQAGVRRPVELYSNSLVSSPLLIGFFRPCIILPTEDLTAEDFTCIVWHELIHFRRKDMFYKWLVQFTACLHWFNPLVWLMGRELNRACEFACDEAVLESIGEQERCHYGDALLRALEMGGSYRSFPVSVTLNESVALLKERLGAIMVFKKRSRVVMMVSAVFTGVMLMGATAVGAYVEPIRTARVMSGIPQDTADGQVQIETVPQNAKSFNELAERYYEMGLYVQFEAVFSALDETAQRKWLDTIYMDDDIAFFSAAMDGVRSASPLIGEYMEKSYEDGDIAFFSVAAGCLSGSNPLLGEYAERAYTDHEISFFSVLADDMNTELLNNWCARALNDGRIDFCSILVDNMSADDVDSWRAWAADEDMGLGVQSILSDEDALDALVEDAQREAEEQYLKWGITVDGDDYYYQGQLVHLFYDKYDAETVIRTIHINPLGTVDVQVTRSIRNKILRVDYMTEEEVAALFDPDVLSGLDCEKDKWKVGEDSGKFDKTESERDVFRLTIDELPKTVTDWIVDACKADTWYICHHGGRQYLYCEGLAWTCAYQPAYDGTCWRVDIKRLQKKEDGGIVLSLPDNGAVKVYCDGEKVDILEIEK